MFWIQSRNFLPIFILLSIGAHWGHALDCNDYLVFRLYTSSHKVGFWELKTSGFPAISTTAFDARRPTRIFIHGYNSRERLIDEFRDAYLNIGDYNFIGVDWLGGACTFNYLKAKGRISSVAKKLAKLLDTLEADHGLDLRDVTIIGHSLGAHIAGLTGKQLKSKNKIGCIVGLDPAGVGFTIKNKKERLDKDDAEYVQDGNKFGLMEPIGHADFYPNGGKKQTGCRKRNRLTIWLDQCSHARAHKLFLLSLTNSFVAVRCLHEIRKGVCETNNVYGLMGGDISRNTPKLSGIFYLETEGKRPYVIRRN